MKGGPQCRVSSPLPGYSTFTTSAPRSPSIIAAYGPVITRVRSTTRMPSRGIGRLDAEGAVVSVAALGRGAGSVIVGVLSGRQGGGAWCGDHTAVVRAGRAACVAATGWLISGRASGTRPLVGRAACATGTFGPGLRVPRP